MAHNHGAKTTVKAVASKAGQVGLGKKILHAAARHPVLLFAAGVAAGVYLYKISKQQGGQASCCDE